MPWPHIWRTATMRGVCDLYCDILCDDGDRCTSEATCVDGACQAGDPISVDDVYFTTDSGVYIWSSDTQVSTQLSSFGAYAIALSPGGDIVVGKGGVEALQTLAGAGVYRIDASGAAQLIAALPAEDLEFDEFGALHVANRTGIYALDASGNQTQRSANPSSQLAFVAPDVVLTTNGSAYASIFGASTDLIDISTPTGSTTLLNGNGGEDVQILDGRALVSGQGGIFDLTTANLLAAINPPAGMRVFKFHLTKAGTYYVGNASSYGGFGWASGLYARADGATAFTQFESLDVNDLAVDEVCPYEQGHAR